MLLLLLSVLDVSAAGLRIVTSAPTPAATALITLRREYIRIIH